jgi:hypothetical protein
MGAEKHLIVDWVRRFGSGVGVGGSWTGTLSGGLISIVGTAGRGISEYPYLFQPSLVYTLTRYVVNVEFSDGDGDIGDDAGNAGGTDTTFVPRAVDKRIPFISNELARPSACDSEDRLSLKLLGRWSFFECVMMGRSTDGCCLLKISTLTNSQRSFSSQQAQLVEASWLVDIMVY